ncbi:MAG: Zn-dependent hydrolase [Leptospiraceae bacterium]|nr:Zn-dependent hydrolase [Leptospiraceae bacterium]MCP5497217.1 Zn-dependent hydrolase [Leptospiraceae bacterium]
MIHINFERLKNNIETLSKIGAEENHAISRMAFSQADMEAREWLKKQILEANLELYIDGAANIFGKTNANSQKPSILIGSHLDTVPLGGHLDGSLGVLVGLECLQRIREENIQTEYPLEMVSFTDEEGRFGGLFGSQSLCGEITPDFLYRAADLNGLSLLDAMKNCGLNAFDSLHARRNPQTIHSYLELHIEQGPVLDSLGIPSGIVEGISGLFKWNLKIHGFPNHAGTTPMPMRKDAFMGLAEFANEIPRILEEDGSENSVATIGRVNLIPGSANTVPGIAEFTIDVRDPNMEVLKSLEHAIRKSLSAIVRRRDLKYEFDIISEVIPANCAPEIIQCIADTSDDLGIKVHRMVSGAIHDAQIMSKITKVGMIFVPSIGGKSHSAAEWTAWEDIEIGANLALNSLLKMAKILH